MKKEYYYIDLDIVSKRVLSHGVTFQATHTGETESLGVHRVFLTKGQFHKLEKKNNF